MQAHGFFQHGLETHPLPELLGPSQPPLQPEGQFQVPDPDPVQNTPGSTSRRQRKNPPKRAVEPGEDQSHYRFFLPPVVGSYLVYENKRVKYNPFPPNLDAIRHKLFRIDKPVLLDSQQIADYWTHVTNFWMRSTYPRAWHNGTVEEVFECRNRRRVTMKGKNRSVGTGMRQRTNKDDLIGDVDKCQQRIKVFSYTKHADRLKDTCKPGFGNCQCLPEWLYMRRTEKTVQQDFQHTHDVDLLDRYKRSDALMYYTKLKIEEGYSYSAVLKYIHERYGPVTTEAKHLSKADCGNVSRPWRLQNRDIELKSQIEDESFEEKQRRECMDAIGSTSQENLAKALAEVCKTIPQAIDIIAPFLQRSAAANGDSEEPAIAEGNDIKVPSPGLPAKRMILFEPVLPTQNADPSSSLPQHASSAPHTESSVPQNASSAPQNGPVGLPATLPVAAAAPASIAPNLPPPAPMSSRLNPHLPPSMQRHTHAPLPAAASSLDPNTTSRAFISESSKTVPFMPPYSSASRLMPPPPQTSNGPQLWPPPSVTHALAGRDEINARPSSAANGTSASRPSWAMPTVPQKRPIDAPPAVRDRPGNPTVVEEISAQLRQELSGA